MGKKIRIAILYICTGKYTVFWKDFYESYEKFFIVDAYKDYFVFTDSDNLEYREKDNVKVIYQENLGWPGNTLFRYRIFLTQKEELLKYDYLFFMNANMICVDNIGTGFLPEKEGLLFVQHPGYYNVPNYMFPYERNKKSKANIGYFRGKKYICGGVNGGKSTLYIKMCEELNRAIEDDFNKGIVAVWHDESHINKYLTKQKKYVIGDPGYCYPEGWEIPFKPKLIVRNKDKYFNVNAIKGENGLATESPLLIKLLTRLYLKIEDLKKGN